MGWPLNERTTASTAGHPETHNTIANFLNDFDHDTEPAVGDSLVWDGTRWVPDVAGTGTYPTVFGADADTYGDDSTDATAHLQSKLDAAKLTGGWVYLPPGIFQISSPLTVYNRTRLVGASAGDSFGGSIIKAAAGFTGSAMVQLADRSGAATWWHFGELANLSINGNSVAPVCLDVGQMGETSSVHHVYTHGATTDGVLVTGESTPTGLSHVSSHSNGRYGFNFDSFTRHAVLEGCSGDANGTALVRVNGPTAGAIADLVLNGLKSESHDVVVLLDDFAGSVVLVGGSLDAGTATAPDGAVKRTGSTASTVSFVGTRVGGYATQFNDVSGSQSISLGTSAVTLTFFGDAIRGVRADDTPIVFDAQTLRAYNTSTGVTTEPQVISSNRFALALPDANNWALMGNGIVLPSSWSTVNLYAIWELSVLASTENFVCWGGYHNADVGVSVNGITAMTSQTVSANVAAATLQRTSLGTVDVSAGGYWKFAFRRNGGSAADDYTGTVYLHSIIIEKAS